MSQPIPGLILNAAIADAELYGNGYLRIIRQADGSKRYQRIEPERVYVAPAEHRPPTLTEIAAEVRTWPSWMRTSTSRRAS